MLIVIASQVFQKYHVLIQIDLLGVFENMDHFFLYQYTFLLHSLLLRKQISFLFFRLVKEP